MSYIFDIGNQTVWSPATRLGKLYVDMAVPLSLLVGRRCGLTAMAEDYYEIDADAFTDFVTALITELASRHPACAEMVHGHVALSMVMLARARRPIPLALVGDDLRGSFDRMSGTMPDL